MDALSSLLDHVRTSGGVLGKNVLSPPWAIRIEDSAALTIVTMLRGDAWITPRAAVPSDGQLLREGDLALVTGLAAFTVADAPGTTVVPLYVLEDPSTCTDASGRVIADEDLRLGARTCGQRLEGDHAMLTGTYRVSGALAERVVSALPRVLTIPAAKRPTPLSYIEAEITHDQPGQQAVLDRLLDLLLVAILRDWFSRPEASPPRWYRAMNDPVVGLSLRAMHEEPATPWTVDSLAREAKVSRATFARRFTNLLGESPIAYLADWRLGLAADRLRETDATVESIARQVGYSTAFALSAAFSRRFGMRPTEYRRASVSA